MRSLAEDMLDAKDGHAQQPTNEQALLLSKRELRITYNQKCSDTSGAMAILISRNGINVFASTSQRLNLHNQLQHHHVFTTVC